MTSAAFRRILFAQWMWSRTALVPLLVVAFAVPILSVQAFNDPAATGWRLNYLLDRISDWSVAYPVLAAATGAMVGITAWGADHRTRHVYALSLPVSRVAFTGLRAAAGLVLVAGPAAAVWVGALLATAAAEIPVLLQPYPNALAGRFVVAAVLSYSIFFAIAAGTARTAGLVLGAAAALALTQLLLALSGAGVDLLGPAVDFISSWPGPLEIFGGRWALIDF